MGREPALMGNDRPLAMPFYTAPIGASSVRSWELWSSLNGYHVSTKIRGATSNNGVVNPDKHPFEPR